MSLEAKIEALTKAVEANTAALLGVKGTDKPGKPIIGADQKVIDSAPLLNTKNTPAVTPEAVTYDQVKAPFLKLVTKSRDLALETLKPFGLDSLKAAKPDQYGAILAAVNKALA